MTERDAGSSRRADGGFAPDELQAAFPFLTADELVTLCPYLEKGEWAADAIVFQADDPADFMGFLVSGRVAVRMPTDFPGRYVLVGIFEAGGMFGEAAVIGEGRRNATIVALESCRAFLLTRSAMATLFSERPALGIKLLARLVRVLSARLKKASDRLARIL